MINQINRKIQFSQEIKINVKIHKVGIRIIGKIIIKINNTAIANIHKDQKNKNHLYKLN